MSLRVAHSQRHDCPTAPNQVRRKTAQAEERCSSALPHVDVKFRSTDRQLVPWRDNSRSGRAPHYPRINPLSANPMSTSAETTGPAFAQTHAESLITSSRGVIHG